MVFYSRQADNDLDNLLEGLLTWQKIALSRKFCMDYVARIINICDSLSAKAYHANAMYETHKQYGKKVHKYLHNKNTTWYIIYDIDAFGNIFINKIISNYLTIS
ncbi:MAG: hypothetical protein LBS63_01110 [Prevotellaceae bacterium]|jgi:hypothetical protein|nr:hypothetical protein [Prevotellaceae bacterium]